MNRNVGYVTQEDTMLPWLTLAANVGLPLRMRRMCRAEVRERVIESAQSFGLGTPQLLSGPAFRRHEEARPAGARADLSATPATDG